MINSSNNANDNDLQLHYFSSIDFLVNENDSHITNDRDLK